MRFLPLLPLLLLTACASTAARETPTEKEPPLPRFRALPPQSELAHKRATVRHAAALAILARAEATPAELEEAALGLETACSEGHRASCDFLEANATPVVAQCARVEPTQEWFTSGGNVETLVRCRISEAGAVSACTVLLDAPYGIAEKHLAVQQACTYQPARLRGRPYPTHDVSRVTLFSPVMQLGNGSIARMGDPLHEARRRLDKFPQSASAQRHLALILADRAPGTEEHLSTLRHARALRPEDPALLAAAARLSMVQGRDAEAFALALQAVKGPLPDRTIVQTYAAAASFVGQCAESVRAQRHALAMLGTSPRLARERSHIEEQLARYEQCAAQAAPAVP